MFFPSTWHYVKMPRGMKRISHRQMGIAALLALTVIATCGAGRVVIPFSIDPATITVPRAAQLSEFAVGLGKRRQLLLNADGAQPRGREWLRLIAHELAHVSQIEMAQGEGRAEQWLAEGMAEWVAFTSLERLGLDTLANRRALATAGIRNHAALVAARLDLETLGNPRGFTVRHLKEGSLPTYQLAFLMADYLIERDGFPRMLDYFKSFERRQDRHSNFRDTFGQSLDQFEKEVLAH